MEKNMNELEGDMAFIEMVFIEWFTNYLCSLKNLMQYSQSDMEMMERDLRHVWYSGLYSGIKLKGAPAHMTAPLSVN